MIGQGSDLVQIVEQYPGRRIREQYPAVTAEEFLDAMLEAGCDFSVTDHRLTVVYLATVAHRWRDVEVFYAELLELVRIRSAATSHHGSLWGRVYE